ncbi:MAG: hypothetical protein WD595_03630 [Waddliaceae bacterium]
MIPIFIIIFTLLVALLSFYFFYRPENDLVLEGENGQISIEKSLLQNYFNAYFLQKFPSRRVKTKIRFKGNQVFVSLVLPPCPIEKQSKTLFQVTSDLYMLFYHLLGPQFDLQVTNRFSRNQKHLHQPSTLTSKT